MKQRMGQQEKAGGPDNRLCSPLDLTVKPFNGVVRPYPCPPPMISRTPMATRMETLRISPLQLRLRCTAST